MPRQNERGRIVWSSELPEPDDAAKRRKGNAATAHAAPEKQIARLSRSHGGRAGKTVIIIEGLDLTPEGYASLAHDLRQALGTGGTVRERVIEVQGDMRDRVATLLMARGYRVKLVGG